MSIWTVEGLVAFNVLAFAVLNRHSSNLVLAATGWVIGGTILIYLLYRNGAL